MSTLVFKQFAVAAVMAASTLTAATALADDAKPASGMVCLNARDIERTKVLNDHQILFYMPGHKVWVNDLPHRCSGLLRDEGFTRVSDSADYCDNFEVIRVHPTGQGCQLGKFSPYEEKKAAAR